MAHAAGLYLFAMSDSAAELTCTRHIKKRIYAGEYIELEITGCDWATGALEPPCAFLS